MLLSDFCLQASCLHSCACVRHLFGDVQTVTRKLAAPKLHGNTCPKIAIVCVLSSAQFSSSVSLPLPLLLCILLLLCFESLVAAPCALNLAPHRAMEHLCLFLSGHHNLFIQSLHSTQESFLVRGAGRSLVWGLREVGWGWACWGIGGF